MRHPSKTTRELVRELALDGWVNQGLQHGGHVLLVHPCGARIYVSATPRPRSRVKQEVRSDARRAIREATGG